MLLNLNDISGKTGAKKDFSFTLDFSALDFPQIETFSAPATVSGTVSNIAGTLTVTGVLSVSLIAICDRCALCSPLDITLPVTAHLAESLSDESNFELYLLSNGAVDLEEIFTTSFLLSLESKTVCNDDCKGLCFQCGINLNEEDCNCAPDIDPRLAALGQLL